VVSRSETRVEAEGVGVLKCIIVDEGLRSLYACLARENTVATMQESARGQPARSTEYNAACTYINEMPASQGGDIDKEEVRSKLQLIGQKPRRGRDARAQAT
jgi:hypothetical protein